MHVILSRIMVWSGLHSLPMAWYYHALHELTAPITACLQHLVFQVEETMTLVLSITKQLVYKQPYHNLVG